MSQEQRTLFNLGSPPGAYGSKATAGKAETDVHHCHWPGCTVPVAPRYWGCSHHWFRLPKPLRDRIWETYRPGQEIDKEPSVEYVAAAMAARQWILSLKKGATVENSP